MNKYLVIYNLFSLAKMNTIFFKQPPESWENEHSYTFVN